MTTDTETIDINEDLKVDKKIKVSDDFNIFDNETVFICLMIFVCSTPVSMFVASKIWELNSRLGEQLTCFFLTTTALNIFFISLYFCLMTVSFIRAALFSFNSNADQILEFTMCSILSLIGTLFSLLLFWTILPKDVEFLIVSGALLATILGLK